MGDEKMQRTISAMVGKGSVNHNSRKFRAENVDGTRTHLNIDYCNENIKTVYHELFDEALERYNAKPRTPEAVDFAPENPDSIHLKSALPVLRFPYRRSYFPYRPPVK